MSNPQEITNPRQELLNVLANLPNIALGADKYTCDASLGEEGNEQGDIVISYHIDAPSSGKTIKTFLKSVEGLKIPNLTIDEKKLQINVKSFDVVLSAVYVYLNKNPDKISKDNVEYLEGLYGDICSSMYPSNVEILGDNLYEGFSHPRTLNLLTNAFELVGNYETQLSLNPEEGEKTNTVLPYLSITLEHVEGGAQFCLFPNTADENVKLKPALESLQTILSDISEDSTVCELSKNDQGFTSLSITEQYYSRMCDLIEGYFQENDLLSISPKLDMSASKEAYTLTAEDLLSVPVQPYVSYEHCVAAFNQATEGSIFANIVLDIRNTIEAEGVLKEDISLIKGVNPQYLAH